MAISENQLDTWSHQGSVTQSSSTYQTIRTALLSDTAVYHDKSFKVFLQGSYGNDTNIYSESDVDTVIKLYSIFRGDISRLPAEQRAAYERVYAANAVYTFSEFKHGVVNHLTKYFGVDSVNLGNKAIKIKATQSRRNADVVVCYEYRLYTRFVSPTDFHYISGIIFPSTANGEIINFPQNHSDNCTSKHQETNSWFKPMVRIMKNMRSRMVSDGIIPAGTAPSYYIEGMLYNVPTENFGTNFATTFCNSVNWLLKTDRTQLNCAHGQYRLLGNSNVQWEPQQCTQFLHGLVSLWKNW